MKHSKGTYHFLPNLLLAIALLCSMAVSAQGFSATATTTAETCQGNGSMTITITNGAPGATYLYTGYLAPNPADQPFSSTSNVIPGLSAGTYNVTVTESTGEQATMPVVIENQMVTLDFTISYTTDSCTGLVTATVEMLNGTAVQYDIFSGPETRPAQTSNSFSGLQGGTYIFRAFDTCGAAVPLTFTVQPQSGGINISEPQHEEQVSGNCAEFTITNIISYPEGVTINYPITLNYTVTGPDGVPSTDSQTYTSGAPSSIEYSNTFPAVEGAEYSYVLEIITNCGPPIMSNGTFTSTKPIVNFSLPVIKPCGQHYLTLLASGYKPPYTINFTAAPGLDDGSFNPGDYNELYPFPYNDSASTFGSDTQEIPEGDYTVEIIDACGRKSDPISFNVKDEEVEPILTPSTDCVSNSGRIKIRVPDRDIVFAEMTDAPQEYIDTLTGNPPLPLNVTGLIQSNGTVLIQNLPLGEYKFHFIDECGVEYTEKTEIKPYVAKDFTATAKSDCNTGAGSVEVRTGNGRLVTLFITDAPTSFEFYDDLPYDVSFNINTSSGVFYMNNLPEGDYTFKGTDTCGFEKEAEASIIGYDPAASSYTYTPNCKSFVLEIADANTGVTLWLQEELPPNSGQWGHPGTGVLYTEGTMPTATNSLSLQNGPNINLQYEGHFRIYEAFTGTGNGQAASICTNPFGAEFSYYYTPRINNIYNLACSNNPDDVIIMAEGIGPLTYYITSPITVDNGPNNIFTGLAPGIYTFKVQDACGGFIPQTVNISLLPNLVEAQQPADRNFCVEAGDPLHTVFDLTSFNPEILGPDQSPDLYTITYYHNIADAEAGTNPIPTPEAYTNISNPDTIFARLVHNLVPCQDIVSFNLFIGEKPEAEAAKEVTLCQETGFVQLEAAPGPNYTYSWLPGGETTRIITVTQPGVYTVTVTNGATSCNAPSQITVNLSSGATITSVDTEDWTENENSVTINVAGNGNYEYSLDGVNYQDSPTFTGLPTGIYTVYAKDKDGCGDVANQKVVLLHYPKFFTPNGDGVNETWRIQYSWFEPGLLTYVYDRYGKLITAFDPVSKGWDGTYNGERLPSTDYWFVVKRGDGEVHRGHFSMIR